MALKREYASKTKSIRQLARDFGVSDTAIRKKAKLENWDRAGSQSGSHLGFVLIDGSGPASSPGGVAEPDWALMYDDNLVVTAARRYWRTLIEELQGADKLANANLHQVKRLVGHYILSDKAAAMIAELGAIVTGKRGGLILNPWLEVLKSADSMASAAEAELTITPRRRSNGGTVQKKKPNILGGGYLKSVPK